MVLLSICKPESKRQAQGLLGGTRHGDRRVEHKADSHAADSSSSAGGAGGSRHSYVPCYISHSPVINFRGVMVCDGAMTSVMPILAGATHVCAFPASIVPFGRCPQHEIGPDMQVRDTHIPPRDYLREHRNQERGPLETAEECKRIPKATRRAQVRVGVFEELPVL